MLSSTFVDETGHKENGEKFWTWVFRADLYVLFKIDKSRGSKVLVDVLGKQFEGVLGCDYFSAYRKYMKDFNITLQFCIAHLIRDIKYLTGLPDPETRAYAKKLLASVKNMFKVIHRRDDLGFHDRLEQSGVGFFHGLAEGFAAGQLEGQLGGIDIVVLAVVERHLEIDDRVAGQMTQFRRF